MEYFRMCGIVKVDKLSYRSYTPYPLTKMNPKEVGEQNNDQRESAEDYREDWRRV